MIKRQFFIKILLLPGLICLLATYGIGQNKMISLEEAVNIARKNYPGLERDRLAVEQQNKLAETGLPVQPTQLYFSGEEFDFNNQPGIHSVNVQQNFYLPKVANIQRAFYRQSAAVAENQMSLTDRELKREVEQAYYRLLFAKKELALVAENMELYQDFLSVATTQLETGETGKIPQLAARSRLGQAKLEQEHAVEKYQIALALFNHRLQSEVTYDAQPDFPENSTISSDSTLQNNPHLRVIQAQRELANANVATKEAQLLPQINSGLKLQSGNGNFPLFGYQIGVNVPLFKKAYHGRIEAAKVQVKMQDANLEVRKQELERTVEELRQRIQHQQHVLEYLQNDLTPIVNEQSEVNSSAYGEGEISYLEYLDGLKQVVKVKQQYLTALYKFHALRVELDYWSGE